MREAQFATEQPLDEINHGCDLIFDAIKYAGNSFLDLVEDVGNLLFDLVKFSAGQIIQEVKSGCILPLNAFHHGGNCALESATMLVICLLHGGKVVRHGLLGGIPYLAHGLPDCGILHFILDAVPDIGYSFLDIVPRFDGLFFDEFPSLRDNQLDEFKLLFYPVAQL